jgi:hypothetical protein
MKRHHHIQLKGCLPCLVFIIFPIIVAYALGYLTAYLTH